jgi:branched-chain amino acid transport system substrate-binding protein
MIPGITKRLASFTIGLSLLAGACAADASGPEGEESAARPASGQEREDLMTALGQGVQAPDEATIRPDCAAPTPMSLTIGGLFPSDNQLSTPPRVIAAELAVEDINAAGGVFGQDVAFVGTVADVSEPDLLGATTQEILGTESLDAVLTVVGSGTSLEIIGDVTGRGVIQMSPNNTSTAFTVEDTQGLYFRTAPSDEIQGRVLSDELIAGGRSTAAVIFRDDAYGTSLATAFHDNFEAAERRVSSFLAYPAETAAFDDLVTDLTDPRPEAIVVIGYAPDSAEIFRALDRQQVGPTSDLEVWAVDGNAGVAGELEGESGILEGLRQTVPSANLDRPEVAELASQIRSRLVDSSASLSFTPETYDALVILALAAVAAGCDGSGAIAEQINDVTRDGTECQTYADCKQLLAGGSDIDYNGIGGVYDFTDSGEPSRSSYRIDTYGAAGPDEALTEYVFGAVCTVCEVNRFPAIDFASGSAELDQELFATLNRVAELLNRPEVGQVEIQGYASPDGSPEANLRLSQERADAVRTYLTERSGVPQDKVIATGFGATGEFPQNRVVLFEEIVPVD